MLKSLKPKKPAQK